METRFYRLVDIIGDRKREIPAIIPVSARTWFRGVADGRFPKPIKLTPHTVGWLSTDIERLMDRLMAEAK
ncbi:helix-turn-helix transcriptional regulator [Chlorobium phaeovibrioides]|nr:AlpA family phage regulatory protein [Chlorobium phaeovibrioides]